MAFNGALTKRKEQTHEITVKTARNFHFRTKHSLKWMILESRQRNEEKGSPMKLHIEFYFNFLLRIIYIATFQNSVA